MRFQSRLGARREHDDVLAVADLAGSRRRPARTWRIGVLVLVGILGLPTLGLVATDRLFRQADLRQANHSNAQAATAVAYEVSQSYDQRTRVFQDLPKRPSLAAGLASGNRALLEQSLRLALRDGQYCRLVLRAPGIVPVVVSGSGPCWSPPAPPTGEAPVHALGVGVVHSAAFSGLGVSGAVPGHPTASLQAVFSMRSLTSVLIPGAGTHTTVVDGRMVVSSSAPALVGETVGAPVSVAMIRARRSASATIYAPLIHASVILAYRPVPGSGLGVFFSVSTKVAYAAARHAQRVLLAGYLVLLAIGFGLAGSVVVTLRRRDRARDLASDHYRSLADSTPDGVAIVDDAEHLIYANPAMVRMTGAGDRSTWLGHPLGEWIERSDETTTTGMQLRHADGHRVVVEGNAGPFDLGGRPGTIWVIRDLTQRQAAEAAVALAEARQRATIATVSDGIVVYDLDGDGRPRAVLMNPAADQFVGQPLGELQGSFSWIPSAVVDADGEPVSPDRIPVAMVARTGQACTTVLGLTAPGAARRWIRTASNPVLDARGTMVGIVTSLVDVTKELEDRVEAETDRARLAELMQRSLESAQALRESDERFHLAFEHAPIGMALINPDGHYEQVNPAMCRIIGYTEAQLREMTVADTTFAPDLAADVAAMDRLVAGEVPSYTVEKRNVSPAGDVIWVSKSLSLVHHEDGSPRHFISQLQDITERKAQEHALAVERRRLSSAESIGRIGSWEITLATGDVALSDMLMELFGLGPEAAHTGLSAALAWVHPEDRPVLQRALEDCQRTGTPVAVRTRLVRADDNRLRWFDIRGEAIYEDGELVRLAGAVIDVTEQVLTAKTASDARDLALEASRQKSAFLATMSHEIRTPMNAVIGMTGLLLDTALDTEQREFVETVRSSGDSLLAIINDILDFSKIEAGGLQLEQRPFDLRNCVDGALDLVSATPNARGLELISDVDGRCPAAVVGDVTRLGQVLVNLLSNAVKFTAHGQVVVRVEPDIAPDDGAGSGGIRLRFSVTDTGIGIPADRLATLFESFSQVDASTTRIYGGTGLGLAISQRLVDAMGGVLSVDSVIGAGSTFHFSAILGRGDPAAPSPVPDTAATVPSTGPRGGLRVLLAEDNAVNQRLGRLMLEKLGHHVDIVGNGREAVDAVRLIPYDAVLMDVEMPEMDGLEATRLIRSTHPVQRQPEIVAMTASALVEDRQACFDAGMDNYLAKPVRMNDLAATLDRAAEHLRERGHRLAQPDDRPAGAGVSGEGP